MRVSTRADGSLKTPVGGLFAVAEDGSSRSVLGHVAAHLWGMALAPATFGAAANNLLISHASNGNIYLLDEVGPNLELFVVVPMQARGLGLRQMVFSPTGWLASVDPELADERVLLVSVVSHQFFPNPPDTAGRIDAWNHRGERVASLTIGPSRQSFEARGLLFVGNELLFSDITEGHGWLISASAEDFGLPDCNGDGILDECEIADGTPDCNMNGVPDTCEVDCNANGVPDQCDLTDGTVADCNGNFIPDSCEPTDCNGNGQPDDCDIASGFSFDVNGNFVPDECDTGSCCDSSGTCAVTVETDCLLGAWTLDGICIPNSCPQPGACCGNDGSCAITLEADCIDGAWTVGQARVPNLCPQPGAGCRVDTSCSFILEAGCVGGAWLEGEVCTLANCPSADCNANGIRDDQDIANATSSDCNGNGVPDECDIAGNGGATIFATGIGSLEEILTSNGDYPPGFFVTGLRPGAVYNVSSLGGTVTTFASGFNWPLAATIAPHEFGNEGERMFVADSGVGVLFVAPSGTVTLFTDIGVSERATGLVYIPQALGGVAGGKLLVTSLSDNVGLGLGSIFVVDADGMVTFLVESVGAGLWTPTLTPDNFGDYANRVFVGEALGPHLYAFDLTTLTLELFATVPLPEGESPGLRQVAFSPIEWAESFDPTLANERVLLVSVASDGNLPSPGGSVVSVWDQRGTHVATLSRGPDGLPFEPRGLLFVKNDLLVSDLTSDHDWLFRVTADDFGLADCDHNSILDECEIAADSSDCNENAVPDECEVDCNANGVADQCDVESGAFTDCNRNFILDSCETPDCNDNGFPDFCDLADGTSRDLNGNQIPDECDTFVGDFDEDKDTDLDDYAILECCLRFSGPGIAPIFEACLAVFDFDTDGDVDLRDTAVFQAEFTGSGE